jgi:tRNA nucleotidyltransferase (CCA-adding enzyme)
MSKNYIFNTSPNEISEVISTILARIKPDPELYLKVQSIFEKAQSIVQSCLERQGFSSFEVSLQGSVAKDTFIRSDVDLDVFILLDPNSFTLNWIEEEFTKIVSSCLQENGYPVILKYATHPYVTTIIDGIEIDIVPAFKVKDAESIITAVDRTPFHTKYVKSKLSDEKQRDEVRILKAFLKAWDLYGAEIKTQGFSGYLAELLIIKYGSFVNVLKESLSWRAYKTCIELEKYYGDEKECRRKFKDDVLVVVDPVDPNRNAAAALSLRSYATFKLLARLFLLKPSIKFFESDFISIDVPELDRMFNFRQHELVNSCVIMLLFKVNKPIPDVVWGQLKRVQRSIKNALEKQGFRGVYAESWISPNFSNAVTLVDIYDCGEYELHIGPPAYDENAINFLIKNANALVGPWIDENGRLVSIRKRRLAPEHIILGIIQSSNYTAISLESVIRLSEIEKIPFLSDASFRHWLRKFLKRDVFSRILSLLVTPS